jgi:hypothetical protein
MLKLAQLRPGLILEKDDAPYIINTLTLDDGDTLWNVYRYDQVDPEPFFTESADWYIVVARDTHKGFLSKDLLLVALNVNSFNLDHAEID